MIHHEYDVKESMVQKLLLRSMVQKFLLRVRPLLRVMCCSWSLRAWLCCVRFSHLNVEMYLLPLQTLIGLKFLDSLPVLSTVLHKWIKHACPVCSWFLFFTLVFKVLCVEAVFSHATWCNFIWTCIQPHGLRFSFRIIWTSTQMRPKLVSNHMGWAFAQNSLYFSSWAHGPQLFSPLGNGLTI